MIISKQCQLCIDYLIPVTLFGFGAPYIAFCSRLINFLAYDARGNMESWSYLELVGFL